jgi:DNA topoisomerase-1
MAERGTVAVIQGPRFSTVAESQWFMANGWDVVNMTQFPECYIARELGMCYAAVAAITDYDVGLSLPTNIQDAHEAIRPTDPSREKAGASPDQQKLYALIFRRTVASQMTSARMLRTKVIANIADRSIPDFVANGSRLLFPGWLEIDPFAKQDDMHVPKLAPGSALTIRSVDSEKKQTEPPRRYSEAGLVKELEKRGIGRPSTYASIIKTLLDRNYATKDGRALHATETGEAVSAFLEKHFADIISDTFTADMEQKLDDISNGERDYEKTLKDFYTPFSKDVKSKDKVDKINNLGDAPKDLRCPECGSTMVLKLGKNGTFYSCSRFPDCKGARMKDGSLIPEDKDVGEPCPECGSPRSRSTRSGWCEVASSIASESVLASCTR